MVTERRLHPREDLALPLDLDGENSAVTRNVSASGLYLEILGPYRPRRLVAFDMQRGRLKFTAEVELVRLDYGLSKTGVALKFASAKLKAIG